MPKKAPVADLPSTPAAVYKAATDVAVKSRNEITDLADRVASLLTSHGMKFLPDARAESRVNMTTSLAVHRAVSDVNRAVLDRVIYRLMLAGRK